MTTASMTMGAREARGVSASKLFAIVIAAVAALALALSLAPSQAYAASKTVSKCNFTTATKTINKKATQVKKGTTKLTIKKGQGYIKFKATKTKKYSFTFKNLKAKDGVSAFVEVQTQNASDNSYSFLTKVSTKGGKSDTLWLGMNGYNEGSGINKKLASRTGKLKLKKGQWVYFYFYNSNKKTTATLKIK